MNALLAVFMLVVLAGCSTMTGSEMQDDLPRARELIGTLTPTCKAGPLTHKRKGTTVRKKKGGKQ